MASSAPRVWNHQQLVDRGVQMLADGGGEHGALIEGRVLSVMVTPTNETSEKMAIGVSVLPPGFEVPAHRHEAEELATVLSGSGVVIVDEVEYPLTAGDVMFVPSNATHITRSDDDGPLVVFWSYAPAGSEGRWLEQGAIDRTVE